MMDMMVSNDVVVAAVVDSIAVAGRVVDRAWSCVNDMVLLMSIVVLAGMYGALSYRWICPVCKVLDMILGSVQEVLPEARGVKIAIIVVRWISGMSTGQWMYVN
jgi:hypothetical protein